jgi:hypothetical protein
VRKEAGSGVDALFFVGLEAGCAVRRQSGPKAIWALLRVML